ncbi:transcriptional regulator [Lysobacteraceae bacterium NML120232]|nr:transcriptional regulator [Xanthomonadaceae bacterium NML08-0793]PJK12408.1 transcriptional regulator [Xanthomonadaceae bacterium NML120232]
MSEQDYWVSLIRELCAQPHETVWLEFKHNDAEPKAIGEYISALANSAALEGKTRAYMIWGVDDATHTPVGTNFDPQRKREGNEELENWLLRLLEPKINFRFVKVEVDDLPMVLLEIDAAYRHPVKFSGEEYVRISSYKKRLKAFQEKERSLWRILDTLPFERQPAMEKASADEVLSLLDYPGYFNLLSQPLPDGRSSILNALAAERLIESVGGGYWNILNIGAILFAKDLAKFPRLQRKAVRVIVYKGKGRTETIREQTGTKGYAVGFEGLIGFINGLLPVNEVIGQALRREVPVYPELAIRELVANALIHQDLSITGSGPMVEIFDNRMEITNPGKPLVDTSRMLDNPPRSRNEALASVMRRMGICEERGSGVDKVVSLTEFYQLPAPAFEVVGESTRSTLFSPQPLKSMELADRIRAVYLHACLRYVERGHMTNSSLRERFGIDAKNSAIASRLIREAMSAQVIALHDPEAAPKLRRYVPSWARSGT